MLKTFQYRIYPTKAQETALDAALRACRWVYNQVLEARKTAWEADKVSLSLFDTMKFLPGWKSGHDFLKKAHSQTLQNVCVRVDLAMKAFFRRCKAGETPGFPRFRGCFRYDSFTFTQGGFNLTDDGKLDMSKIGRVKIILHRPTIGDVRTLTVKRTSTGKWFASFSCEVEAVPLPAEPKAIGVDMGLTHFLTTSEGRHEPNPRFFKQAEKALAKVQRRFSQEDKGTPERRFRRQAVALTHEKTANKRKDFAHKLSHRLVKDFGTLCFEDLNITKMVDGYFAKGIHDAAWNQLIQFTSNKAACAGRKFALVNPAYTSQTCHRCLQIGTRKGESFKCGCCGYSGHADHNASLNILRLGLESLALGA